MLNLTEEKRVALRRIAALEQQRADLARKFCSVHPAVRAMAHAQASLVDLFHAAHQRALS
jgi:hypothetical protein